MRSPPTTAECIEELAALEPAWPALREEGQELSYAQLDALVAGCAAKLERLGLQRGDRVAVSGPGFALQLVFLLAAEAMGAATASFQAEDDPDAPFLFTQVQWVFSPVPQDVPVGVRFQRLDAAFLRDLPLQPGAPRPVWRPLELHEPQRITRTSGSTGRSKFMVLRRAAQEHSVNSGMEKRFLLPGSRLLVLAPLVMNAAFSRSSCCLRRGALVLAGGTGAQLPALAPTDVWGLPLHLQRLLDAAPAGYVAPGPVRVATVGGVVTPALRDATRRVLGAEIRNRYGSNEGGGICEELGTDGSGVVAAGIDVRIVDDDGRDLPMGEAGRIAVRSPSMADGYLALPAETAAAFRDGWFVSADLGVLLAPRRLRLLGRVDDLVNLGGLKLPAAQLEGRLHGVPDVREAAVVALQPRGDAASLGLAVALLPGSDPQQATQAIAAALQFGPQVHARLLFVPDLPRLRSGKVDRPAVLRLFLVPDAP